MITRYDIDISGGCSDCSFYSYKSSDGDYVLFDDYASMLASLCREFEDLKEKYDLLVGKIGDIYQEA